jgi:acetylornithine deacetylase
MGIRAGFHPGMTAADAKAAIEARIAQVADVDEKLREAQIRVSYGGFHAEGFVLDRGLPMMRLLAESHGRVMGSPPAWLASTATTDARVFNLYGATPATCYGPEATFIHGIDESVSLESTRQVTRVLALFLARWCGVESRR